MSQSTALPPRPEVPLQYPLLALHVIFGSVAMVTAPFQVWPWLRNSRPKVHRRIGLVYYFGGVIPSGILAIPTAVFVSAGQSLRMALFTLGVLWLFTTYVGFRAALQGRYDDHRRWMVRNVALTTSIITARLMFMANFFGIQMLAPDTYPADARWTFTEAYSAGIWGGLVVHLIIAEWISLRPRRRARRATRTSVTTG
ncbi:DUF2306 domain-containing protein [Saccharothrix hoggarensis]|uniref:DUF2306 domain-containing protein n=1 Tax=Saccharothrix hoggarensis TaxID=913853 RepID=UPI0036D21655